LQTTSNFARRPGTSLTEASPSQGSFDNSGDLLSLI
jgi:hypothetical protein